MRGLHEGLRLMDRSFYVIKKIDMSLYVVRVLKYIVRMFILLGIIFGFMYYTNTAQVDSEQLLQEMFFSSRGEMMMIAILLVALAYPKFGYMKRTIAISMSDNSKGIEEAFGRSGYSIDDRECESDQMIFRAKSPLKRAFMMWDDRIVVRRVSESSIEIDGVRKDVSLVEYRLKALESRE